MISPGAIIDDLLASESAVELTLQGLTAGGSEQLLAETVGQRPDPIFAAAAYEATGGNAFLLTELARSLREHNVAPVASEAAHVGEMMPRSVVRRVRTQLRRLSPAAESLACAAAVLGLESELRHAAMLADLDLAVAAEAADGLYAQAIVADVSPLVFEHAFARSAILSTVPPAQLAAHHGRAARILLRDGAPAERVAAHVMRTPPESNDTFAEVLVRAADAALRNGDALTSVAYLERALREGAATPPRWSVLHQLGSAAALIGRPDAVEHLRAAFEISPPHEQPRVALPLGDVLARSGATGEAYEILSSAIDKVSDSDAALACQLETLLLIHSQVDPSMVPLVRPRVRALRDLPGDTEEERSLLAVVAYITAIDGGPASVVLDIADRALARGEALRQVPHQNTWAPTPSVYFPFGLLSRTLSTLGDVERAQHILDWIRDSSAALGRVDTYLMAMVAQAALSYTVGDVQTAADYVETVIERSSESNPAQVLPLAAGMRAATAIELGDFDAALAWLGDLGLLGPLPELGILDVPLYFRGLLRAKHGDVEAGLEDLRELGRREQRTGHQAMFNPWRVGAASVLAGVGRFDEARPLIDQELAIARTRGVTWNVGMALRVKGIVEHGESGIAALEEAVAVLEPWPFRLERARAHVELGAALRRTNRRAEARAQLETGLELATRCGSTTLRERAATELAATGARPRRLFVTGSESLTATERRVAQMAAAGRSNPEIAQALFVSRKTIETHLSRVYQKLGISSRSDIAEALAR